MKQYSYLITIIYMYQYFKWIILFHIMHVHAHSFYIALSSLVYIGMYTTERVFFVKRFCKLLLTQYYHLWNLTINLMVVNLSCMVFVLQGTIFCAYLTFLIKS